MKEFFESSGLKSKVGAQFDTKYFSVSSDIDVYDIFTFLDYYPLVNARAHRVGGMEQASTSSSTEAKRWILNDQLRDTYKKFILYLTTKKPLQAHDRLMLVNYLLMQERVVEAIEQFKKIPEVFTQVHGAAKLQYDYIKAYLDFFISGQTGNTDFTEARVVLSQYRDYPVLQ